MDKAGIRRYSKRDHYRQIDNLSLYDAFCAIDSAQAVIVVVGMIEPKLYYMDVTIAQRVTIERCALMLVVNKSDLAGAGIEFEMQRIQKSSRNRLLKCAVCLWHPSPQSQAGE